MAVALKNSFLSRGDYLDGELISDQKHEYFCGEVYAMAGGTANHEAFAGNFLGEARSGLKDKPCRPFNSDFLVRVPLGGDDEAFYYPDGMIVCAPISGDDRFTESPVVILEVLSDSTRSKDEVQKLRHYFSLPSLQVYLLAETDQTMIRVYRRHGDKFTMTFLSEPSDTLDLPEVDLQISVAELYRDIDFEA